MATLAEIESVAEILPEGVALMLCGCHGCGKTEWVANTLGPKIWGINRIVTWHPAHAADAGDVTGLPEKVKNISGQLVTKFCPPDWMVQNEPVVLLIDEANRGLKLVQNAIMQLTCSGTYDNISLPEGSRIVACINPDDSLDYDVGGMDLAQKDRFLWAKFAPSVQETLNYWVEQNVNQRVIDYISDHPVDLDFEHFSPEHKDMIEAIQSQAEQNGGVARAPSCRSWFRAAKMVDKAESKGWLQDPFKRKCLLIGIEGLVGTSIAANFNEYLNRAKALSAAMVMNAPEFTDEFREAFKEMDAPAATTFFGGVNIWMKQHYDELTPQNATNYKEMITSMKVDIQRALIQSEILSLQQKNEQWLSKVNELDPEIKDCYVRAIKCARVAGAKV